MAPTPSVTKPIIGVRQWHSKTPRLPPGSGPAQQRQRKPCNSGHPESFRRSPRGQCLRVTAITVPAPNRIQPLPLRSCVAAFYDALTWHTPLALFLPVYETPGEPSGLIDSETVTPLPLASK